MATKKTTITKPIFGGNTAETIADFTEVTIRKVPVSLDGTAENVEIRYDMTAKVSYIDDASGEEIPFLAKELSKEGVDATKIKSLETLIKAVFKDEL